MEAMLAVAVPDLSGQNEGVDELVRHALLAIAKYQERPGRQDFVMRVTLEEPCTAVSMQFRI